MRINDKNDFIERIKTATPAELIVINYELLIMYLDDAAEDAERDDGDAFQGSLLKARRFLIELQTALDMEMEISQNLTTLYIYINGLLIESARTGQTEPLTEAKKLLGALLESWRVAASEYSAPADVRPTVPAYGRFGETEDAGELIGGGYTV
jgi:flagellar protein FliS